MKNFRKGGLLMGIGGLLIAAALALCAYNIWDDARASRAADSTVEQMTVAHKAEEQSAMDELPVISDWSYPALKVSPCRYDGSAYTGDLILSAHNYRSHFGCLKDLAIGETVRFTDMDGNVFRYSVMEHEVLMPYDVEEMKAGDWDLTLFTCTVGGTSRFTVRCDKVE